MATGDPWELTRCDNGLQPLVDYMARAVETASKELMHAAMYNGPSVSIPLPAIDPPYVPARPRYDHPDANGRAGKTCATCRWHCDKSWTQKISQVDGSTIDHINWFIECRGAVPVVSIDAGGDTTTNWPIVDHRDWCAKWAA